MSDVIYDGQLQCPCCEEIHVNFLQAGKCSNCGCNYRHRIAWLFMQREMQVSKGMKMLYFTPDKSIAKKVKKWFPGKLKTSDFYRPKKMDYGIDMENIKELKDNTVDFILALNVLEYVTNDTKAMSELHRILKPKGLFLTSINISEGRSVKNKDDSKIRKNSRGVREHTKEYDATDRPRYAKRKYGLDIRDRLENAGFVVSIFSYGLEGDFNEFMKYDLKPEERIVCCSKRE